MLLAIAIVVMKFQGLLGQGTISIISGERFECSSSVKLRCVPASGCCGGTIEWKKAGSLIVTGGSSTIPEKYVQTTGSNFFDLTINDINTNDLDSPYHCVYSTVNSNQVTIRSEKYYCPSCTDCGWNCFGLVCWGVLTAYYGVLLLSKYVDKLGTLLTTLNIKPHVVAAACLIVVFAIIFPVGTVTCWCERSNTWWLCAVIGLLPYPIVIGCLYIRNNGPGCSVKNTAENPING